MVCVYFTFDFRCMGGGIYIYFFFSERMIKQCNVNWRRKGLYLKSNSNTLSSDHQCLCASRSSRGQQTSIMYILLRERELGQVSYLMVNCQGALSLQNKGGWGLLVFARADDQQWQTCRCLQNIYQTLSEQRLSGHRYNEKELVIVRFTWTVHKPHVKVLIPKVMCARYFPAFLIISFYLKLQLSAFSRKQKKIIRITDYVFIEW